jgi:hypothetical protein
VNPRAFLLSIGLQTNRVTLSRDGGALNRLAFSEARRYPEIAASYRNAMEYSVGLIRAALQCWRDMGLLPLVDDVDLAARVCHSMLTDRSRVWTALGLPHRESEWETYTKQVVDTFLAGCGYTGAKKPFARHRQAKAN